MWTIGEKQAQAASESENFTFLGKGVDFKGVLNFDGTVRVDGRLEGEIHTTGTLIVGEHAVIKGTISAGVLMTSGKINGTVTATERIQLLKPAVLIGDIRTPAIAIEDGAHFHGMCDMGAHKWVDEQPAPNKNVHDLSNHRSKVRSSDR
ncbi:MAG: bactofilin family protein [Nitrospiraceae bacterium]